MSVYTVKQETAAAKRIAVDDMLLTTDMPTAAGSKMLDGYMSLLEAEAVTRLRQAGYDIVGKANVGEFGIDLLGETSAFGAVYENEVLRAPAAEIVSSGDVQAVVGLDVNGALRRAAAQSGLCSLKPTYGTVSRYGTIPVACSGETVSVLAETPAACGEVLGVIAGHDDKDGTSLPDATVQAGSAAVVRRNKVVIPTSMLCGIDAAVNANIQAAAEALRAAGCEVIEADAELLTKAGAAWNILMAAELCNNVSRYDGVKYGYRSPNYTSIDELYTNSRTEAFGDLLKATILFGSETLSTENYSKVYDKALRVRRVIGTAIAELLADADALLMPACSTMAYAKADVEAQPYTVYRENVYTAPASITGLPAVVAGGVQLVGCAFSDAVLLSLAEVCRKGEA